MSIPGASAIEERVPSGVRARTGLLVLLSAISVADGYDLLALSASLPVLLHRGEWGITAISAGNIASIQMLGLLVGALLSGYLGDRIGRRRILIANLLVFSVFTGTVAIAPNLMIFAALRFLGGLGLGGIIPVLIAMISEFSPPTSRYTNNAIMLAGSGLGALLAPVVGAGILGWAGFQWLFAIGGVIPLIMLVPLAFAFVPESIAFLRLTNRNAEADRIAAKFGVVGTPILSREDPRKPALRSLFSRDVLGKTIAILVAESFIFAVTFGMTSVWLPQYLVMGGFEITNALLISATASLGAVTGAVVGGWLQDRVNPRNVVITFNLIGAATLAVLGFVLHVPWLVFPLLFAFGFTGTLYLMNGLVANVFPVEARGTILGLAFGVGRAASVIASSIGGIVAAAALAPGARFWVWAIPLLVPALALLFIRSPGRTTGRSKLQQAHTEDPLTSQSPASSALDGQGR